jgi:RNA 2',3'-cyclic 3'-phosphodiesterase
MRTFLAIELPSAVREQLLAVQVRLRALPALACFRWVPVENVHLTLRFLGETDQRQQQLITQEVQRMVDRQRPLSLAVGGAGTFPNFRAPNIIWLGVQGELAELAQFQAKLEQVAQQVGLAAETRPFSPLFTPSYPCAGAAGRSAPPTGASGSGATSGNCR